MFSIVECLLKSEIGNLYRKILNYVQIYNFSQKQLHFSKNEHIN